jgi:hypothetical protein
MYFVEFLEQTSVISPNNFNLCNAEATCSLWDIKQMFLYTFFYGALDRIRIMASPYKASRSHSFKAHHTR